MKPFLLALIFFGVVRPAAAIADGTIPNHEVGLGLGQAIVLGNQTNRLSDAPALYIYWMKRTEAGVRQKAKTIGIGLGHRR